MPGDAAGRGGAGRGADLTVGVMAHERGGSRVAWNLGRRDESVDERAPGGSGSGNGLKAVSSR